mgnify:CR=1 FL=1
MILRKIKKLLSIGFLSNDNNRKCYMLNFLPKEKDTYLNHMNDQIKTLSRFISKFTNHFNLNLNEEKSLTII